MSRVLPIIFNTEMVRAILEGRKTVTRRICKDADEYSVPDMDFLDISRRTYAVHGYSDIEHTYTNKLSMAECTCPICPGDTLYVRETWSEWTGGYVYRAWSKPFPQAGCYPTTVWHPSIHMPKEAARIWLKVIDVKVDRLCRMTLDDFLKEGVNIRPEAFNDPENAYSQAKTSFISIWDATVKKNAGYNWSANPWVWVIEFERCEKPEVAN